MVNLDQIKVEDWSHLCCKRSCVWFVELLLNLNVGNCMLLYNSLLIFKYGGKTKFQQFNSTWALHCYAYLHPFNHWQQWKGNHLERLQMRHYHLCMQNLYLVILQVYNNLCIYIPLSESPSASLRSTSKSNSSESSTPSTHEKPKSLGTAACMCTLPLKRKLLIRCLHGFA